MNTSEPATPASEPSAPEPSASESSADAPAGRAHPAPAVVRSTRLQGKALLLAVLALALGGFGIGTTEFSIMGLLQEGAADLGVSNPDMGYLISTYALGVVVGAPLLTALGARIPHKTMVLWLTVLFTAANFSSVLAPTYEWMLVTRFLSGLPHGAYFGLAAILAGTLVPAGMRGRAIAWVIMGLNVANVAGVPVVTWLGQQFGWRWMFAAVALTGALTWVGIKVFVPFSPAHAEASIRRELTALRRGQVWLAMATGIVGFGGFFAVYSFISPILTDVTGLPITAVPLVLAVYGLGMVIGGMFGGRLADVSVVGTIVGALAGITVLQVAFGFLSPFAVPAVALVFLLGGAGSVLVPSLQALLMDSAPKAQSLAASLNHSALNIANALGAALGAAVISAGLGYQAPAFLGAGLAALGLVLALITGARTRRRAAGQG
ncbi:putative permease of the major facilitator superfamily protein [Zafaria cholistanensis]|uniref:Putative permease of the major facilitator superfamily protein n=1 Tax=Zafaria cholistanensis TaxID=1682741 RepID=A0A5A7NTB4_9MICC|nr:MFS transporter [Zafaria cholistanensis]GER23137.1 putative permease of the major facilitator superfamily protein [Zafaria cholistanensis]